MNNDSFTGNLKSAVDFLGNAWHYECMGCAIVNGSMEVPGGIIYNGEYAYLSADPEVAIPGFLIVSIKRHVRSFSELQKEERIEVANIITYAERAIKSLNIGKEIVLIQEERSKHLHIWIFPYDERMKEKFGSGSNNVIEIMKYVKENNVYKTSEVLDVIEKVRKYFNEHDINL